MNDERRLDPGEASDIVRRAAGSEFEETLSFDELQSAAVEAGIPTDRLALAASVRRRKDSVVIAAACSVEDLAAVVASHPACVRPPTITGNAVTAPMDVGADVITVVATVLDRETAVQCRPKGASPVVLAVLVLAIFAVGGLFAESPTVLLLGFTVALATWISLRHFTEVKAAKVQDEISSEIVRLCGRKDD